MNPFKAASVFIADWEIFQQALFHPLVNAVKFNKPGGQIDITLCLNRKDENMFIECKVQDTGRGIAEEDM